MSRLTRDGTAEPVSRDQILRHARGQGNVHFPCSADHEQDWQPYPVDPYSAICDDHTYIHTPNIEPGRHQRAKRQKRVRVSDNTLETDRSVLKRSPLICDVHGGFFKISLHFWVLAYIRQTDRLRGRGSSAIWHHGRRLKHHRT